MKTKINVVNEGSDKSGERRAGVLDIDSEQVLTSNGVSKSLSYYEKIDPNGVGFFETRDKGKIVQEKGRYKMKKV